MPTGIGAPYTLLVSTTNAHRQRITSLKLSINGADVFSAADLYRNTAIAGKKIDLRAHNTLKLSLAARAGVAMRVRVFGTAMPIHAIDLQPNPVAVQRGATVTLKATLSPTPSAAGVMTALSSRPNVAQPLQSAIRYTAGQTSISVAVRALILGRAVIRVGGTGGQAHAHLKVVTSAAAISALQPATLSIEHGAASILTVRLDSVRSTPTAVTLAAQPSGIVSLPSALTVPAGALSASVNVATLGVGTAQVVAMVSGASGTSNATASVTVTPSSAPAVVSLLPPTSSLVLGASTPLSVAISSAQSTPTTIALSVSPTGVLSVPASLVIPAGQTTASFNTTAVALGSALVRATLGASSTEAAVTVVAPLPTLASLTPDTLALTPGANGHFTLALNAAQPIDTVVPLSVSDVAVLEAPASVTVAAGQSSADFSVTGLSPGTVQLSASLNGSTRSASIKVAPPAVAVSAIEPARFGLQVGATASATLRLNAAQTDDTSIPLSVAPPDVLQVPLNIVAPAGQLSAVLPVTALSEGVAVLSATLPGSSANTTVTVSLPPVLITGLTPDTLSLAKGRSGTLHLAVSPAPTTSLMVTLAASNGAISVPAQIPVPAGALSVDIPVVAASEGTASLTASLNGSSASANVTVTAPEVQALDLSPLDASAFVGDSVQYSSQATLTDGTLRDDTARATWGSSNEGVARINSSGTAQALATGSTQISATSGAVTASSPLTVLPTPTLTLGPTASNLAVGATQAFTVTSSAAAEADGLVITLSTTGTGSVTLPASVGILAGQTSASFSLTATGPGTVVLSASAPHYAPASATLNIGSAVSITHLTPSSGPVGSQITLHGSGFDPSAANDRISFSSATGGVLATVVSASATQLVVTVPVGAQTGPITLTTPLGSTASPVFTVQGEQDFSVSASPAESVLVAGTSTTLALQPSSSGTKPYLGLLDLAVLNLPGGVTARLQPATLSANQNGAIVFTASASAPAGRYDVLVQASGATSAGRQTKNATATLIVQSASGATGVKGRFVTPDGTPVAGVLVRVDARQTATDAAGNFLLVGLPSGPVTLRFDATPAHPLYPIWPFSITLTSGKIEVIADWTINPPPADEKFVPISNAAATQKLTDARYPGFAITLPAGVSIIGWDGVPKTRIAVERIPLDKLPVPMPPVPIKETYQLYFGTPMGGIPSQPIPVTLPNVTGLEPGEKTEIWYFDGSPMGGSGEWKVAGLGTISADGKTVASDPGVGIPRFCGVCGLFATRCPPLPGGSPPSPGGGGGGPGGDGPGGGDPGGPGDPGEPTDPGDEPGDGPGEEPGDPPDESGCNTAGNPIELFSGYAMPKTGGLRCRGLTPMELGLSYHPVDAFQGRGGLHGSVGDGWVLDHDIVLADAAIVPNSKRLILPPNSRINFALQPDGSYTAQDDPRFQGAVLRLASSSAREWVLLFKDGRKWRFGMTDATGLTASFLIETVDASGNAMQIVRRADRKITAIGTAQRSYTLSYGANGFVDEIRDPANRSLKFSYNAANRIEAITNPAGGVKRYTYVGDDQFPEEPLCPQGTDGQRISTNSYPGRAASTQNFFSPSRRVVRQLGFDGREFRFSYLVSGACVTHIDQPGVRCTGLTCPTSDSWENVQAGWRIRGGVVRATTITRPDGTTFTRRYNAQGMVVENINAEGQSFSDQLDANNRTVKRVDALGRVTRFTYDAQGNVTRHIDALGRITDLSYDARWNKPTSVTRFESDGSPVTALMAYHTSTGNLVRSTNPLGQSTTFDYTAQGQLASINDALGHRTALSYNPAGDLIKSVDPLGNDGGLNYDLVGRPTSGTDPMGYSAQTQYNALDQVTQRTDALGGVTRYAYDAAHRLSVVTNALNQATEIYAYDAGDHLTSRTDALGRSETLTYDAQGRVATRTDRKGQVKRYSYDAQSRLTRLERADGTLSIGYDAVGRVQRIDDSASGGSTLNYEYDNADRVMRETQSTAAGTNVVAYEYDALDRRIKRTVNGTEAVTYAYDKAGRLTSISYAGQTTSYAYDAAGRLISKTLPNGIKQTLSFDKASRLLSITYSQPDATVIETISYEYDANGRRTSKTSASLSTAQETGFTATYDAADRMTAVVLKGIGIGGADESCTLSYDGNGNLVSKTCGVKVTTYNWDAQNRLSAISAPGITASFGYDAFGRRVMRTLNGTTTSYVYDGAQAIGETKGGINATLLTGLQIDEAIGRYASTGNRTMLTDALGSVIAEVKEDRTIATRREYTPYGQSATIGEASANDSQYTAREEDGSGLYFYRARYYDAQLKRFVSDDPIGLAGGINRTAYVGGDPISRVDPSGHFWGTAIRIVGMCYTAKKIYDTYSDAADGLKNQQNADSAAKNYQGMQNVMNEWYSKGMPGNPPYTQGQLQAAAQSVVAAAGALAETATKIPGTSVTGPPASPPGPLIPRP